MTKLSYITCNDYIKRLCGDSVSGPGVLKDGKCFLEVGRGLSQKYLEAFPEMMCWFLIINRSSGGFDRPGFSLAIEDGEGLWK